MGAPIALRIGKRPGNRLVGYFPDGIRVAPCVTESDWFALSIIFEFRRKSPAISITSQRANGRYTATTISPLPQLGEEDTHLLL